MAVIFRCALQEAYSASPGWLGSRVVSVLDSDTEGPVFKSQSRRCRVTVLGKLFTPIVPLFTKQRITRRHKPPRHVANSPRAGSTLDRSSWVTWAITVPAGIACMRPKHNSCHASRWPTPHPSVICCYRGSRQPMTGRLATQRLRETVDLAVCSGGLQAVLV